ncbi:MAG: 2,3-cyclic phosphodiesterase [Planctomycetota bacterium]
MARTPDEPRRTRCFVAADLPDRVQLELHAAAMPLHGLGDCRWSKAEQLHVTLCFLGDIEDAQLAAMARAVRELELPTVRLSVEGLGQFPGGGTPRVIWGGVKGDVAVLERLAARFRDLATGLGIEVEDRRFAAHVTLARVRSPRGSALLTKALQQHKGFVLPHTFRVPSVSLYASERHFEGHRYRLLARAETHA